MVFDVKCGSGAFMKDRPRAEELARSLVGASADLGLRAAAVITDMDQPLGRKIGNFLEAEEAIDCLRGRGPLDVVDLTCRLTAWMLVLGKLCPSVEAGEKLARDRLKDGSAWTTFLRNVELQGGDLAVVREPSRGPKAPVSRPLTAPGPES